MRVRAFDYDPASGFSAVGGSHSVLFGNTSRSAGSPLFTGAEITRVEVAAGDLDGDGIDEVVASGMRVDRFPNGPFLTDVYGRVVSYVVEAGNLVGTVHNGVVLAASVGGVGGPFSIEVADLDNDGLAEFAIQLDGSVSI